MSPIKILMASAVCMFAAGVSLAQDNFPDGTPVPEWFREPEDTRVTRLGRHYRITDYDVASDSTLLQTEKIQAVIEEAHRQGGGVIIIPSGVYLSGALFFRPRTHLHIEEGGVLKGSDDISHFPLLPTRMEGQTLKYFAALVNADRADGFTISGKGTIDGNGLRYWKAFWLRREFNPQCTNMDEMRPRLVYISNSKGVRLSGVRLMNSPFWTTHFYRCQYVKLLGLRITSPASPVKAPSTDAVDLDVCSNVLIKNCYMSVNDDAVALKGGKGPFADKDGNNGENRNIIIEDCTYGFCHSALTCGSEAIHNRNIVFRRNKVDNVKRLLQLKMRPDTPQRYEHILLEDITGNTGSLIDVKPWTQFFDLKGEQDIRVSYAANITLRNIQLECGTAFDIVESNQYELSAFTLENLDVRTDKISVGGTEMIKGMKSENVKMNGNSFTGDRKRAAEGTGGVSQWEE